ncbi:retrovirus-related pol polyprotein from transposon TNT 1-94 [Tanacetum coccineum]
MVPRTVLTRSGPISLNTARPVNTVQPRTTVNNAGPMKNVINNAYSTARRPFNKITAANNNNFTKKVNTVKGTKIIKKLMEDLLPLDVISIEGKLLGKTLSKEFFTCLFAKATPVESNLWHRRLGHVNFKTTNKLGIKREFSVARTPQQNRVAKRKNRTLIKAARTMLADSKLPTTFWAKVVNTACYVQNRVLVIKPHNKTPYELFLGKFDGKANEGFFLGYSTNSKAFRVLNSRTSIIEENLHVQFSENTPNIARSGPNWLFNIDALTNSMNYKPVVVRNQSNGNAGTKACDNAGKARVETVPSKDYILLPLWTKDPPFSSISKDSPDAGFKPSEEEDKKDAENPGNESGNPTEGKDSEVPSTEEPRINQEKDDNINSTNNINTASDGKHH